MKRILLIGGNSDAVSLIDQYLQQGCWILHSSISSYPMSFSKHPRLFLRQGALDVDGFQQVIRQYEITQVVDASHPYAIQVQQNALQAAECCGILYERYVRPCTPLLSEQILRVADHEHAAVLAAEIRGPVLLTTGSRILRPYVEQIQCAGQVLWARILDDPQSLAHALNQGMSVDHLIPGRGPFTVDQNEQLLRRIQAKVLVTKDSGVAGGVPAKIIAARNTGCQVILIERPK